MYGEFVNDTRTVAPDPQANNAVLRVTVSQARLILDALRDARFTSLLPNQLYETNCADFCGEVVH